MCMSCGGKKPSYPKMSGGASKKSGSSSKTKSGMRSYATSPTTNRPTIKFGARGR